MRVWLVGLLLGLGVPVLGACASSDSASETDPTGQGGGVTTACVPGQQTSCVCGLFNPGVHACLGDGSGWGECKCEVLTGPCGDGVCSADDGESCHTCAADCGACAPCTIAPECSGVMVPPEALAHVTQYDVPAMNLVTREQIVERLALEVGGSTEAMRVLAAALASDPEPDEHPLVTRLREIFAQQPAAAARLRAVLQGVGMASPSDYRALHPLARRAGGTMRPMGGEFPQPMDCGKPLLRIGVSQITVHEEDDDVANDEVYCVVQTEAQEGGEIRVTPMTPPLDQGQSYSFSLESGVFWGQMQPRYAGSDILVTYDCIESDTNDGYANLLSAIGQAAIEIGGVIPGEAGWIVVIVGVVAELVGAGLAMDGDDHLFNVQQLVSEQDHLALTNGAWWSVRRSGTHLLSDWDWELYIKAWGCAQYGTL